MEGDSTAIDRGKQENQSVTKDVLKQIDENINFTEIIHANVRVRVPSRQWSYWICARDFSNRNALGVAGICRIRRCLFCEWLGGILSRTRDQKIKP